MGVVPNAIARDLQQMPKYDLLIDLHSKQGFLNEIIPIIHLQILQANIGVSSRHASPSRPSAVPSQVAARPSTMPCQHTAAQSSSSWARLPLHHGWVYWGRSYGCPPYQLLLNLLQVSCIPCSPIVAVILVSSSSCWVCTYQVEVCF